MRGKRDAFGVDPGTGFDGVRATEAELEAWRKANPGRSRPAVARSRCQRCGTRIWHSGIAVGAHRGSKKCRETAARLDLATAAARLEAEVFEPRRRLEAAVEDIARVAREWPDGVHTCAELQKLEPGRRPCTCGRCPASGVVWSPDGGRHGLFVLGDGVIEG
jgi:hypothetical protein